MKTLLFIPFLLVINSCYTQQNKELKDIFFDLLKKQNLGEHFELKESFNGDSAYFNNYKQLFEEQTSKVIKTESRSHIAFNIVTETTTYKINLFEFYLMNKALKKEETSGEFTTKALIGYYYIEYKKRSYLLLINKVFSLEDRIINSLVERIKNMINT